eukprot:CAMPEP_0114499704 /NCGR_PEP_ID=MMETSP0109-20121206/7565_1 /TAXON_ID=29199 /ORGANISM="Chlorarachnion reptans, Strain CCCM449" /LENGTH=1419 /DNA_ID=CAMNT_0001677301 /DNA_START=316 /DNA_END=4575 /DNA_ORIENTATION=+
MPGIQAMNLDDFLNSTSEVSDAPSGPASPHAEQYKELVKKQRKTKGNKKREPATIEQLDAVFKNPEEFGRYLGVVGAEEQQEVLFICEVEQLLGRVKSMDQKMLAAHESKIGQMYLHPNGAGHYQIKSLTKEIRQKLQASIDSDETNFEIWRQAQFQAKKLLCQESIPAFLEFVNRQAKGVNDDEEDYKYVFSIHDVFRNPSCACAFFLFMLKDRKHRLLLFWIDLTKERVGDLRKTLDADPDTDIALDLCLKLEAIHHKYVHSQSPELSVLDGETLWDVLNARSFMTYATAVEMKELGREFATRLAKMFTAMDKIIRRECWPDFCTSDLYKGAVDRVYDEKGQKTRAIAKGMHKKLKELAAAQEMYVAFCRDAEPSPDTLSQSQSFVPLLEYVAVLIPEEDPNATLRDQHNQPDPYAVPNSRYVRRWPAKDRSGLPLPPPQHLAGLCFHKGDPVQELLQRVFRLEDDQRLYTRNVQTKIHIHSTAGASTTKETTLGSPWAFDEGIMAMISDSIAYLNKKPNSQETEEDSKSRKRDKKKKKSPRKRKDKRKEEPPKEVMDDAMKFNDGFRIPVVRGIRLYTFVLTVMGGTHLYAACLQIDPDDLPESMQNDVKEEDVRKAFINGASKSDLQPPSGSSPSADVTASTSDELSNVRTSATGATEGSLGSKRTPPPEDRPLPEPPRKLERKMQRFSVCIISRRPLCTFLREALLPLVDVIQDARRKADEMANKAMDPRQSYTKQNMTAESENSRNTCSGVFDEEAGVDPVLQAVVKSKEMGNLVALLEKEGRIHFKTANSDQKEENSLGAESKPNNITKEDLAEVSQSENPDQEGKRGLNEESVKSPSSVTLRPPSWTSDSEGGLLRRQLTASIKSPDFSMGALLWRLQPKRVLLAVEYLLMERKVLLLSHNASTLTAAAAALRALLFPFEWNYLYVPVLAPSMFQYLDCPTPYLVGVSAAHRKTIMQIPSVQQEALIVDLENDAVFAQKAAPLPAHLPLPITAYLLDIIKRLYDKRYPTSLPTSDLLWHSSEREIRGAKLMNLEDPEAALAVELRVGLAKSWAHMLSGYRRFCNAWPEKDDPGVVFDAPTFLNTKQRYNVSFLKEIFKTGAFRNLLESRAMADSPDGLRPVGTDLFDVLESAESHRTFDSHSVVEVDIHVQPRPRFREFLPSLPSSPPDEKDQPSLRPLMPKKEPPKAIIEDVPQRRTNVTVRTNRKLRPKGNGAKKSGTNDPKGEEFEDPDAEYFEDAISITDSDEMVSPGQVKMMKQLDEYYSPDNESKGSYFRGPMSPAPKPPLSTKSNNSLIAQTGGVPLPEDDVQNISINPLGKIADAKEIESNTNAHVEAGESSAPTQGPPKPGKGNPLDPRSAEEDEEGKQEKSESVGKVESKIIAIKEEDDFEHVDKLLEAKVPGAEEGDGAV